ncbi:unnamed protein product [Brassica napus]|uniref:(rape) hypothetical protein n=1 Tax=Brassica napus TaxID=3708 RepID=A0A816NBN0_BRANA|nr:unnamed protein product [Brassica napus]
MKKVLKEHRLASCTLFQDYICPLFYTTQECFHACVAGCGYKFGVESEEVNKVKPKRPPPPPPKPQPPPRAKRPMQPPSNEDVPTSSA